MWFAFLPPPLLMRVFEKFLNPKTTYQEEISILMIAGAG
jgi:hypothetical protein